MKTVAAQNTPETESQSGQGKTRPSASSEAATPPRWPVNHTHAMATLLPSMMMCLSSGDPGSLGSVRV